MREMLIFGCAAAAALAALWAASATWQWAVRRADDLRQGRKSIVVKTVRRLEKEHRGAVLYVGELIQEVGKHPERRKFFGAAQAMLDYRVADTLEDLKKDDMVFLKIVRVNGMDCQTCGLSERVKIIDALHATTVVA